MTIDPNSGERLRSPRSGKYSKDSNPKRQASRPDDPENAERGYTPTGYLRDLVERCWASRERYKEDQSRILMWVGTLFISALVATGLVGALRPEQIHVHFGMEQFLIFATMFVITFAYFKYKQLSTDLFDRLGSKAEARLRKMIGVAGLGVSFLDSKRRYIGRTVLGGRSLAAFANLLVVALLLVLVFATTFDGMIDSRGFWLGWRVVSAVVVIAGGLIGVELHYRRRRKQMCAAIDKDWPDHPVDRAEPIDH